MFKDIIQNSSSVPIPLQIPGCVEWFDMTDVSTMIMDESFRLSLLRDKSGGGRNAYQSLDARKLFYNANQLNGLGAISGNAIGVNRFMNFPGADISNGYTVIHVFRSSLTASSGNFSQGPAPGLRNGLFIWSFYARTGRGGDNIDFPTGFITGLDTAVIFRNSCNPSSQAVRVWANYNANERTSYPAQMEGTPAAHTGSIGATEVSGNSYCDNNIYEIIVYNREITDAEVTILKKYITDKYTITWV